GGLQTARDKERRFSQAVAREESFATKTARLKRCDKSIDRAATDRLGAVKGNAPTSQIQIFSLAQSDLAHAQVVSEVWPATRGCLVTRDRLEPAQGPLHETERRHQDAARAAIHRLQHVSDQTHVVVERQPAQNDGLLSLLESNLNHALVVQEVVMGEHDTFGRGCRSGSVLNERQRLALQRLTPPLACETGIEIVSRHPRKLLEMRLANGMNREIREDLIGGEGCARARIFDDRPETRQRPL